jgi:hypothetical protein
MSLDSSNKTQDKGQTVGSKKTLEETEETMKNPETLATFDKQDTRHRADSR